MILLANADACPISTVNMAGGTLSFRRALSALLGGLKGNGNISLTNGAGVGVGLAVGLNNQSTVYSGVLSGTGLLLKSGTGTLTLSGANTYSGDTGVSGGVLTLDNTFALQKSTLDYNSYGGSLSFGTLTDVNIGGLKGSQNLANKRGWGRYRNRGRRQLPVNNLQRCALRWQWLIRQAGHWHVDS